MNGILLIDGTTVESQDTINQTAISGITSFVGTVTANTFIKSGGSALQYLMADGSVTTTSGSGGNSSNIYLYDNNLTTTPVPSTGTIRFNNVAQASATIIYVSSVTRDSIDIDEFLTLISDLNIVYIQDQSSSLNFIKFSVTAAPTIVLNSYISIPVSVITTGGTGTTSFGAGLDIFMSIFSNTTLIDNRITTLETACQNQTAVASTTTFTGGLTSGTGYGVTGGTTTGLLIANGTVNTTSLPVLTAATSLNTPSTIVRRNTTGDFSCGRVSSSSKVSINGIVANNTIATNFTMNNSEMTTLTGAGNVCIGQSSGTSLTSASANVFCGQQSGQFLLVGNNNTGIGNSALRNCTASFNTGIGSTCLTTCTTGEYNVGVGWDALQLLDTATECTAVGGFALQNNTASFNSSLGYNAGSTNTAFSNITCLGNASQATASNQVVLGNSSVTEVKSTGVFNSGIGFKTPTGVAGGVLCANGTINSTIITSITTLEDITDWRYQANSYYGATPTASTVDAEFFMAHLGNTISVPASSTSNTLTRKYKVQSNITTPADGAVCGFLGGTNTPPIFVRQGFKIVIGFSLGDTTTNAQTRTMIGLFQSTTPPVLNTLTNIAGVTTQSMGIVQESGENVWSFNTRGSASATKVATTISCQTPSLTWYTLEITNVVNSNVISMKLTSQDAISAVQVFTCGTTATMSNTALNFIQLQRNMSSFSGLTGSAILQTASFRLWSSV
jgi:hypothetical protein